MLNRRRVGNCMVYLQLSAKVYLLHLSTKMASMMHDISIIKYLIKPCLFLSPTPSPCSCRFKRCPYWPVWCAMVSQSGTPGMTFDLVPLVCDNTQHAPTNTCYSATVNTRCCFVYCCTRCRGRCSGEDGRSTGCIIIIKELPPQC